MAKKPPAPRVAPPPRPWALTPAMRVAVQPYINKLLKRYREVALNGETELPDPLCKATGGKGKCYACPVFGDACIPTPSSGYSADCKDYIPQAPVCVDDQDGRVTSGSDVQSSTQKRMGTPSSRQQAREWGQAMVEMIESWRGGVPEADL